MQSKSQKVLVAGAGKSGISSARLLLQMGGEVVLYDSNSILDAKAVMGNFQPGEPVSMILGQLLPEDLRGVELCVISPGISLEEPFVVMIREAGIPIWGEVQLAYHCSRGRLAAITGTNGKTTTTALVGEILKAHFEDVHVVGNIGIPYTEEALKTSDGSVTDAALRMTEGSVTVAEISSFQLETVTDFHPNVSAILNITPDHLNRHHTMECYIAVKESITASQTEEDTCVLNYDDEVLREFGQSDRLRAKAVFFSSRQKLSEGYCIEESVITYHHDGKAEPVIDIYDMNLLGRHNHENVMAAVAMCVAMGVPLETIRKVVRRFKAVEHRIEFVREHMGVRYYNDSKGTNPDAAIQAVKAMPGPIILIGGGYDKGSSYDEWIESFDGNVKYLVLLGQTRDAIAACAKQHGFQNIMFAEDMAEAVRVCAYYAEDGDCVLLSPACASWGMFKNYEERGRIFKECVMEL